MTTKTEAVHAAAFLLSGGPGHQSRENITVLSGEGKLAAGQVLGRSLVSATATASAKVGNTGGSGTITMDVTTPVLSTAKRGRYSVICIEPATNAGVFEVTDPEGVVLGTVNAAGSAFANQIKFTISDATDFVAGDGFVVDVTAVTYKFLSADPTNTDGSAVAVAILLAAVDATGADAQGVAIARLSEVNSNLLTYDANVDNATKKAVKVAELQARGILVR